MPRTRIDGDQIKDESIEGKDILDGSVQRRDLDITTAGESVITKVIATGGLEIETSTGADDGTGIVTLKAASGGFGSDFYSVYDGTLNETSSLGWVEKLNVATDVQPAGETLIFYSAAVGQSKRDKAAGYRIEYRINDTGIWNEIILINNGLAKADAYEMRTGFFKVAGVPENGFVQLRMSYGQALDGGTVRIKNAGFVAWRT